MAGYLGRFGFVIFAVTLTAQVAAAAVGASRDYRKVQNHLRQIEATNTGRAQVFTIGRSGTGDLIEGLKIGDGPVKHLVVATHHGNEYGSTEVAIGVAEDLAMSPLPGLTVYVLPVLNISGFNRGWREEFISGYRTADPNRDYPGACGTEGPFRLKSTKALADFVAVEGIVAVATLHTFGPAVMYPWGFATRDLKTAYEKEFIDWARVAAGVSGYPTGNSTTLLYPAAGTFEDYVFWQHGAWSLLFELGHSHFPTEAELKEMRRVNVPGIRQMLAMAPKARAADHTFTGICDPTLRILDRHDE